MTFEALLPDCHLWICPSCEWSPWKLAFDNYLYCCIHPCMFFGSCFHLCLQWHAKHNAWLPFVYIAIIEQYPTKLISYTSSSQMLQIQLQMVQRGAAVPATNNENAEHTKNDWNCKYLIGRDEDEIKKTKIWLYLRGNCCMMPCLDFGRFVHLYFPC